VVRLGIPLPPAHYTFLDYRGIPATKEVRYWAAQVIGGSGRLVNEIDEVAWLDAATAHGRLDYSRDRVQLRALMAAHDAGALATWPLIVVRHGRALQRSNWRRPDWLRPLDARGREQSKALIPLLAAEPPGDVVLRRPLARIAEDLLGVVDLDQPAGLSGGREVEERRTVTDPRRLLHVVGDDDDRVLLLDLIDQVLDRQRRDRVERRARLVHEEHLRLDGDRPGDAQALLLTAGEARAGLVEPILDLIPQVGARAATSPRPRSALLVLDAVERSPAATLSKIVIVGNGFGRWKTMPTVRRTATGSMSEA
jgi:hypothetical protein